MGVSVLEPIPAFLRQRLGAHWISRHPVIGQTQRDKQLCTFTQTDNYQ